MYDNWEDPAENEQRCRREETQWCLILEEIRGGAGNLAREWRDWLSPRWTVVTVRVPASSHLIAESENGEGGVQGLGEEMD